MGATLHHVNLKTTRMKEMMDWYGLVVGMTPRHVAPVGAWLSNDAANHRLALLSVPGLADNPEKDRHTGLHHLAFEFPSLDELVENYLRLRDHGVVPVTCLDHGMTTSMYYEDPDRNIVETQADNFQDWAKSSEFVRNSPEFAANPIGVFFDPDRASAAFKEGRSAEQLHQAIFAGEMPPSHPPKLTGLPPAP